MYHQLNKLTGRLTAASSLQAPLYPIAPRVLQVADAPKIEHTAATFVTVSKNQIFDSTSKRLVPGTNQHYSTVPENIRSKQELFQKENDLPVFLKGGPADALLYRFTMLLCIIGLAGVVDLIYGMATPKKE